MSGRWCMSLATCPVRQLPVVGFTLPSQRLPISVRGLYTAQISRSRKESAEAPSLVDERIPDDPSSPPSMDASITPTPRSSTTPSTSGNGKDKAIGMGSYWKRWIRPFANLKLAIAELGLIAALSSIGTIIEQNKPYSYYLANYPNEGKKVAGFVTADFIYVLQLDHIYSSFYFLGLLGLLAVSLAACTATTQWPMVKVAQRWRFRQEEETYRNFPFARKVPMAFLHDLGVELEKKGYQLFVRDGALYAFKGLAGKIGPIGVHASMLAAMAGIVLGSVGGFSGSIMVPEDGEVLTSTVLHPASPLARLPAGGNTVLHVDDFRIEYRSDGSIKQFFTDVTAQTIDGKPVASTTMSVNKPFRFGGITAYQTDWSMAALTIRATDSASSLAQGGVPLVNIPMASLSEQEGVAGKLYASFLPIDDSITENGVPRGISFLARDLQTVTIYDASGQFAGVRRPGSGKPIEVEGIQIVVDNIVSSSGMELKADPGVPLVYAGFGGICVTTVISYLSHSQVWAYQKGVDIVVGGRSNRARFGFEKEMEEVLELLPEAE